MGERNRINYGIRQGDWRRGSSRHLCRVRSSKALMPFFPALHVNYTPHLPPYFSIFFVYYSIKFSRTSANFLSLPLSLLLFSSSPLEFSEPYVSINSVSGENVRFSGEIPSARQRKREREIRIWTLLAVAKRRSKTGGIAVNCLTALSPNPLCGLGKGNGEVFAVCFDIISLSHATLAESRRSVDWLWSWNDSITLDRNDWVIETVITFR